MPLHQKALASFTQALNLATSVHDQKGEAASLSNLGIIYNALEDKQKALDHFKSHCHSPQQSAIAREKPSRSIILYWRCLR
jgi:tetratricopeptide (TPR) repeat protein